MASPSHCSCCSEKMLGRFEVRTAGGAPHAAAVCVWLNACVEKAEESRSRNAVKGALGISRTLNEMAAAYHTESKMLGCYFEGGSSSWRQ